MTKIYDHKGNELNVGDVVFCKDYMGNFTIMSEIASIEICCSCDPPYGFMNIYVFLKNNTYFASSKFKFDTIIKTTGNKINWKTEGF